MANFGTDQLNRPAPLGYRRFSSAAMLFFIPALYTLFHSLHISHAIRDSLDQVLIFAGTVIKGFSVMLGNGQYYSPSNKTIDAENEEKK